MAMVRFNADNKLKEDIMRMSRKTGVITGIWILALASVVQATDFTMDPMHSNVGFIVRHIGSNVKGQFGEFSGNFSYDPKAPEKSTVEAVIQTKNINTNVDKRDAHLKSPDFFDVEKFPTMTFKSTSVKSTGSGKLDVSGDLTIHGITKPVVLSVEGGDVAKDPWGGTRTGFTATTKINRKDYGMIWNKTLDNGGVLVGDEVKIDIEAEGVAKK
jgi:polyisoprenoid-binding protein YceI